MGFVLYVRTEDVLRPGGLFLVKCMSSANHLQVEHNPLLERGVIPDTLADLLNATANTVMVSVGPNLTKAKHITGTENGNCQACIKYVFDFYFQ